jgi:hypothetical protein
MIYETGGCLAKRNKKVGVLFERQNKECVCFLLIRSSMGWFRIREGRDHSIVNSGHCR